MTKFKVGDSVQNIYIENDDPKEILHQIGTINSIAYPSSDETIYYIKWDIDIPSN